MDPSPIDRIDAALVRLARELTDSKLLVMLKERAGVDLERSGFVLLARLEELGSARLGDVAAAANIEVSTASRQMARLLDAHLVRRERDVEDRRAMRHRLTPKGTDVLARMRRARREWLGEVLAEFDAAERRQFAVLFSRFIDSVAAGDA